MDLRPLLYRLFRFSFPAACLALLATGLAHAAPPPPPAGNILSAGSFDNVLPTYVPWAGVDAQNCIHGLNGKQLSVDDSGHIGTVPFGSSVAVADLNGDGKNDLIVADSKGFFWYFPNTGTPTAPAFTQAEVVPIWLGEEPGSSPGGDTWEGVDNVVPRIQLLDFSGAKRYDVVAGTYAGKLFHIPNSGSSAQPNFKPTQNRDSMLIPTRKEGVLWCNYLAPFMTSAFTGNNIFDLVMGEGTYSANSIWLLHNTDTNDHPMFNEEHTKRIIPGMGLEQLTPCVTDWNNDGKPDIISGDRTGYIDLFLNNSTDTSNPTFAPGVHVKVGGQEKLGNSVTVTVCDLSNNHLPNLLIGKDDGTILYAVNTGTPGNPQFNTPATPLKGVLPPDYKYTSLTLWNKWGAWGVPYEMIGAANPQLWPGFTFPEGVKSNYALHFWVWPYKNQFFQRYYMPEENDNNEHHINCSQKLTLKMNQRYKIHCWVKAPQDSVSNFRFYLQEDGPTPVQKWAPGDQSSEIGSSSEWTEFNYSVRISNDPDPTIKQWTFTPEFRFHGQAPFFIDNLTVTPEN